MADFFARLPLKPVAGAASGDYQVTADFDGAPGGRRSTTIRADARYADLVAVFPGELWFRKLGDDGANPRGDLVLALSEKAAAAYSRVMLDSEKSGFFVYENVTLDRATWLQRIDDTFRAAIDPTRMIIAGVTKEQVRTKSREQLMDRFVAGKLSFRIPDDDGAAGDVVLPTVVAPGNVDRVFSVCAIPWDTSWEAPNNDTRRASARSVAAWSLGPEAQGKKISEHPDISAIPLGYFFGSLGPASLANGHRSHPLLDVLFAPGQALVEQIANDDAAVFFSTVAQLLAAAGLAPPTWRCVIVSSPYMSRTRPVWRGWQGYLLDVDGARYQISYSGRAYLKLANGERPFRVVKAASNAAVPVRLAFADADFADPTPHEMPVGTYNLLLAAQLAEPTFTAKRVKKRTPNPDPSKPDILSDAGSAEPQVLTRATELGGGSSAAASYTHSITVSIDDLPAGRLCSGRSLGHSVLYAQGRFGVQEVGGYMLADEITRQQSRIAWPAPQTAVLAAVSSNEGGFDAVNNWDIAYLSFGVLQWTVYTNGDQRGELAGFLRFVKTQSPLLFREYFGQFYLGSKNVVRSDDLVPRGFITLHRDEEPLTSESSQLDHQGEGPLKNEMRDLSWARVFGLAAQNVDVRWHELLYAYDRLRILRDTQVTLAQGVTKRIADVFTSINCAAYLFDSHTNNPSEVPKDIVRIVTTKNLGVGPLNDAALATFLTEYAASRKVNDRAFRNGHIDAANLSNAADTMEWPDGDRWDPAAP